MNVTLTELISVSVLQELQDSISRLLGVPVVATDEDGVVVTRGINFSRFCAEQIRSTELGIRRCAECDKMGAIKTREAGKPVVYTCHAGMLEFVAPIMLEGQMIGSLIGGQVRTEAVDEENSSAE